MKTLGSFLVRVADLVEAEGRAVRRSFLHFGLSLLVALGLAAAGTAGLGLIAVGLFLALEDVAGTSGAAVLSGAFLLGCAGAGGWLLLSLSGNVPRERPEREKARTRDLAQQDGS